VTLTEAYLDELPVSTVPASALRHGDLYQLERLPAVSALGNDRRVITVASLLTIRAVRLEELVLQSGLNVADCEAALMRLMSLGVLLVIEPAAILLRERSVPPRRRSDATRDKATEVRSGVIARLRDRLGLGGR
jgi:hypothetical protein